MNCPLCDCPAKHASWLGSTFYLNQEFIYVECSSCSSLFCEPMPSVAILAKMYGTSYGRSFDNDPTIAGTKEPERVLDWLNRQGTGTFIDYGCGNGHLLEDAARLHWNAIGFEFDTEVAQVVETRTGLPVLSDPELLLERYTAQADVVHLGDVIEHLTILDKQMPEILSLVKPGGLLIAQGPLEANPNLFTFVVRKSRQLRPNRRTEMAPYHVVLASSVGQRTLFRRFGLAEVEYRVHEVAWPAPNYLTSRNILRPREVALFLLRRASQLASTIMPRDDWGNRYFFVGRRLAQVN